MPTDPTPTAVKAAYLALSPAPATDDAALAALNAQTDTSTVPIADVPIAAIHGILLLSVTADWERIEGASAQALSATWETAPTTQDQITLAAKSALALPTSQITAIQPSDWASFVADLTVLEQGGVISSASLSAIQGLAVFIAPHWSRTITEGDLQSAKAQP